MGGKLWHRASADASGAALTRAVGAFERRATAAAAHVAAASRVPAIDHAGPVAHHVAAADALAGHAATRAHSRRAAADVAALVGAPGAAGRVAGAHALAAHAAALAARGRAARAAGAIDRAVVAAGRRAGAHRGAQRSAAVAAPVHAGVAPARAVPAGTPVVVVVAARGCEQSERSEQAHETDFLAGQHVRRQRLRRSRVKAVRRRPRRDSSRAHAR